MIIVSENHSFVFGKDTKYYTIIDCGEVHYIPMPNTLEEFLYDCKKIKINLRINICKI